MNLLQIVNISVIPAEAGIQSEGTGLGSRPAEMWSSFTLVISLLFSLFIFWLQCSAALRRMVQRSYLLGYPR